MNNKEVPVLLLTGYLGSGKTTLLNKILANKKGIKFAVIVNDIGEVNIDAALIEKGGVVGQKDDVAEFHLLDDERSEILLIEVWLHQIRTIGKLVLHTKCINDSNDAV